MWYIQEIAYRLYFEKRNIWIGIYWNHELTRHVGGSTTDWSILKIYICLIPMLPFLVKIFHIKEAGH